MEWGDGIYVHTISIYVHITIPRHQLSGDVGAVLLQLHV